ncbi:MAG: selenide, water dikinase SelD [Cyclobacteriaceae bacterium]|nr:selenide, water dikinase SelD [Cyclobacteriaceae bacterium]
MNEIKLTQFSHGAGCGCKIAPAVLEKILQSSAPSSSFANLIVGNETKDDAAVYELTDGTCIISTTDFFMPIVDDSFTFGAIASANALSDVYAMGGKPLMALAILGWPVDKLPIDAAQQVLQGSRTMCEQAGIPLAGGHSIDSQEPIFGLAVTGTVKKKNLKRNNTAKPDDLLYLTKPLGTGIITTAQKRGLALAEDVEEAVRVMTQLNTLGIKMGELQAVTAMTDVTGFGLLGHLLEVCEGSAVSAEIDYTKIPLIRNLSHYTSKMIYPDNTMRNWQSLQLKVNGIGSESLLSLCDPQTSGGLLICVRPDHKNTFEQTFFGVEGLHPIGKLTEQQPATITIHHG